MTATPVQRVATYLILSTSRKKGRLKRGETSIVLWRAVAVPKPNQENGGKTSKKAT